MIMIMVLGASALDWANFAVGTVGSLGTVAGLVVAIALGMHEVRKFRQEARDRDEQRQRADERDRRRQAEQVSAVAKVDWKEPVLPVERYGARGRHGFAYADVLNGSSLPIYDTKVGLSDGGGTHVFYVGFIPGGERGHTHLPTQSDRRLHGNPLEVAFRDAGDRWWHRCTEGHLTELDEDLWPMPTPTAQQHPYPTHGTPALVDEGDGPESDPHADAHEPR